MVPFSRDFDDELHAGDGDYGGVVDPGVVGGGSSGVEIRIMIIRIVAVVWSCGSGERRCRWEGYAPEVLGELVARVVGVCIGILPILIVILLVILISVFGSGWAHILQYHSADSDLDSHFLPPPTTAVTTANPSSAATFLGVRSVHYEPLDAIWYAPVMKCCTGWLERYGGW